MKCEVIQKQNNPLLKREEILLEIENNVCPRKEDILNELKLNKETSLVKKIHSFFGKCKFKAEVFVYKTEEDKKKVEKIPKKIRKKLLEESKKQQESKYSEGKK